MPANVSPICEKKNAPYPNDQPHIKRAPAPLPMLDDTRLARFQAQKPQKFQGLHDNPS